MVILFEQDTRDHGTGRFAWKPDFFRGTWRGRLTWKIGWGCWSISCYPEPGIGSFFDWIEQGKTGWSPRTGVPATSPIDRPSR